MGAKVDIVKKAEEIRSVLQKYNGLPSSNEDRAGRSIIMYYIKNYSDVPEIRALIDDFSLAKSVGPQRGYEARLKDITDILEKHGCIPEATTNPVDYQAVLYFFKHYMGKKEVQRLKYLYADSDCFPLANNDMRKSNPFKFLNRLRDNREWGIKISCDYVLFVYKKYGELPVEKSIPMDLIRCTYTYTSKMNNRVVFGTIRQFVNDIIDLGCDAPFIYSIKNYIERDK